MPAHVLIVDDESTVLSFVRKVLERAGFEVLCAPSAQQALDLCKTHVDQISVVVTDIQMPEMDGRELANCLATSHFAVPILFMTGYIMDSEYRDNLTGDVRLDGHLIIRKPFRAEVLVAAVETLLRGKAVAATITQ